MLNFQAAIDDGRISVREGTGMVGCFATDASDLRFPPGKFPDILKVKAFGREISLKAIRGDENSVTYDSCGNGLINLVVFND